MDPDGGLVTVPGEMVVADIEDEVLGDLVLVHDPPGPQADLACAADAPGAHLAGDRGEELFCGLQEVLAHAGALGGQVGIAVGEEALAGVGRVAELGEVLPVEQ